MESIIVKHLKPEFEPVSVVWSNTISDDTFQFKKGRFGCVLYLFARASIKGKVSGGRRDSIICTGGRAALGFGNGFKASEEMLNHYSAVFSKGLKTASDKESYLEAMEAAPRRWRSLYEYGERRHCSPALAKEWLIHGLPDYDIDYKYVLFKPISLVEPDDNLRAVIFPVSPVELSGLVTLAGSVMPGTDPVQVPQGADCNRITAFAYAQTEMQAPRAILGMLDVDGREVMNKWFHDDTLTLTLPAPLYYRMEDEASDCIFNIPSWKNLSR